MKGIGNSLNRSGIRCSFVIPSMAGGGAERQMSYLVNHAASRGYDCTLITLSGHDSDAYRVDSSVHRVALNAVRPSTGFWDSVVSNRERKFLLRKAILDSQPQSVISFCDQMNILTLAAMRPLVGGHMLGKQMLGKQMVSTVNQEVSGSKPSQSIPITICERSDPRKQRLSWLWEQMRRYYYPRCNACVVQTEAVGVFLKGIIGRDKPMHIIPTAFQASEAVLERNNPLMKQRQSSSVKRLLYAGRLSREKGIDRLLDVWPEVQAKCPNWRLVVAGEGIEKQNLVNAISDPSVRDSIDWLGWVPQIRSVMMECDAMVLPSYYEGFPNALVEGMDCGLPCLATDCSASISEIISNGSNGMIVSNSAESLQSGLIDLLSNEQCRAQFRENAKASVAKFHWEFIGKLWDKVLELN